MKENTLNLLLFVFCLSFNALLHYHKVEGAAVLYFVSGFFVGWSGMNLVLRRGQ